MGIYSSIKKVFKTIGYATNIKKPNSLIEKLERLKTIDFYPYSGIYRGVMINSIFDNIITYTYKLDILSRADYTKHHYRGNINNEIMKTINVTEWFCNRNSLLKDPVRDLHKWIDLAASFIELHSKMRLESDNDLERKNFIIFQTYIINIEHITEVLLSIHDSH